MIVTACMMCCSNVVKKGPKRIKRKFLDSLRIHIKGGSGGMGYPKYGGIGGGGGNVYAVGKEGFSLQDIIKKFPDKRIAAPGGENSHSRCIVGHSGTDVIIDTPLGVTVFNEAGKKLGEIDKEGDKVLIARGGLGGCKETGFSGERGEKGIFIFDLKLIADVGLVGFPNAGKSTLLSALSNVSPRIASYPFTTLHPQIGTVLYPDLRQITVADLPGLIEGAHVNIGLGHRFLKHIERTRLLTLVVDVGGFQLNTKYKPRNCLETIILLNKELEMYREDLVNVPTLLVVNKMDKPGASVIFDNICQTVDNLLNVFDEVPENLRPFKPLNIQKVLGISAIAKKEEEINEVKNSIRDILDSEIKSSVSNEELSLIKRIDCMYNEHGPHIL